MARGYKKGSSKLRRVEHRMNGLCNWGNAGNVQVVLRGVKDNWVELANDGYRFVKGLENG